MDVVSAIIKPVAETLMVPVKRHLGYVIYCTKYVTDMRSQLSELNATRIGVEEQMNQNTIDRLEVPAQVRGWLEDVGKINAKVEDFPTDFGTCFSLKIRHRVGRKAFKIIEEIESVARKHSMITWTNHPIPLGKVDFTKASVSAQSTDRGDFESREQIFTEALQALQTSHKSHMIAICGMGGVGKTTMMQRLKKVVQERKMFDFIVEAVIGQKTDPIAIQEAVADYLSIELKEKTKSARADKLCKTLVAKSDGGKNKFLVILDDVWQFVDLNDIGLSPLPNQGVNFKVLMTSRDKDVCTMMGVEANSILNMKILPDGEAQSLFRHFVEISNDDDPQLHKMGEDIVRKCCGLPIAIKTMALTLKNKSKDAWKDALSRLEHHDIHHFVNEVFEISYDNLQDEETKSIFFLCGLFPEDFNIPPEELVRYGWGLNFFKKVYTIREARTRLNTCIERLIHTNLLMEGDVGGCVKMHDLVLAFVLDMFSKSEHASIVNHGSMSGWTENDMSSSCQRISLTCKGMSGFPRELKFPNLSILKLIHGDKLLRFPPDFYEEMEKLQVVSYHEMKYPLLPSSRQCSTNLRVLQLHQCSLMSDCSSVGNLLNLEVLSFAYSGIEWLPSAIGNLKKLKLLDLTNCFRLRIDKGVLKKLVKLEEIYMKVVDRFGKAIRLTDDNCNEMAQLSKNLSALEFEFFENNAQPKNMSFDKLERFKISMGRYLTGDRLISSRHSFKNTLKLVTGKGELLESRMNELLDKTEVLCLSVGDMNLLEDVAVKSLHPPRSSSFHNLSVLVVSDCAELRYLFTIGIAKALSKLEHLEVHKCDNMEELIHIGNSGEERITFSKLKLLYLHGLTKLSGLCHNVNIIELPQLLELKLHRMPNITNIYQKNNLESSSLLKEEVVIPKLEKLHINDMKNLKEIWPCDYRTSAEVKLRAIKVEGCDSLVNLFPCNPMPFLHHLEELLVEVCPSIEVLFNIDLDSVDKVEEEGSNNNLRIIVASQLVKLREVWRIKCENNSRPVIRGFQAVESITVGRCKMFKHIFTPTTTIIDLGALLTISIHNSGENWRNNECADRSQEQQYPLCFSRFFPKRPPPTVPSGTKVQPTKPCSRPNLEATNEHLLIQPPASTTQASAHAADLLFSRSQTNILLKEETLQVSDSISNVVFPFCFIHSFHNLRVLNLWRFGGVEAVFEIASPTCRESVTTHHNQQHLFPYLEEFVIESMDNINRVWKCNWTTFSILQKQQLESPFHNLTNIHLKTCGSLKYLFSPLMARLLSNLKKIKIEDCGGIEEVVSNRDDEVEENNTSVSTHTSTTLFPRLDSLTLYKLPNLKCIGGGVCTNDGDNEISSNNSTITSAFVDPFKSCQLGGVTWSLCQYSREISIKECDALSSVIPCLAAGQMQKLQMLLIESCSGMKELFKTQVINSNNSSCDEGIGATPAFPRLNNGILLQLVNLKELCINTCNLLEHVFPFSALESLGQLEELRIIDCKAMKVIVKEEHDDDGEQRMAFSKVVAFPRLKRIKLDNLPELVGFFCGLSLLLPNLKVLRIEACGLLEHVFTLSALESLRQLEELTIQKCNAIKVIVKEEHDGEQSKEVVVFPRLKSIILLKLPNLVGFFMGMNDFQLPLLDDLMIEECPQMVVFTSGQLTAPKLKHVQTGPGTYSLDDEYGLNFHVTTTAHHQSLQIPLRSLNSTSSSAATSKGVNWSYRNLVKLLVFYNLHVEKIIPSNELLQLQKLEKIHVGSSCDLVEEVFEGTTSGSEASQTIIKLPNLSEVSLWYTKRLRYIWKSNQWTVFEFPNLTTVDVTGCHQLEHVFTSSMVGSLLQLQKLSICLCNSMEEVIVKGASVVVDEEETGKMDEIMLPRLKSLVLDTLPRLKGFFLGRLDFSFPLLDALKINGCPAITVFTQGRSATPELQEIETSFGSFYLQEDINSFIKNKKRI